METSVQTGENTTGGEPSFFSFLKESQKKRIFYGQADRSGKGGGSAPSALAVSKCEHFDPLQRA